MITLALALAGALVILAALVIHTVQRKATVQRRTSSRAVIHFAPVADPACPGPDLGTLSWLIWDGLDR